MKAKKSSGMWSSVDTTGPENHQNTAMPENIPPPPPPPPNSPFFKRGKRRPRNGKTKEAAGDDCSQRLNTSLSSDNDAADDRPAAIMGITESMGSLEVEEAGTGDSVSFTSWKNRLKWLQGRNNSILSSQQQQDDNDNNNDNAHTFYYSGGPMNVDGVMKTIDNNRQEPDPETTPSRNHHSHEHHNDHPNHPSSTTAYPLRKQATSSFSRVASWFSGRSSELGGGDSLASFDEGEWTPPDSSYGAAIPVGGWIPKPIRRTIEGTLIALGTLMLVYMVVTTSMRVTNERNRSKNNDGGGSSSVDSYMDYKSNGNYAPQNYDDDQYYGGVYLDDDRYVAYDKNDYEEEEEDGEEDEDEEDEDGADDEQDGDGASGDEQGDGDADGDGGRYRSAL